MLQGIPCSDNSVGGGFETTSGRRNRRLADLLPAIANLHPGGLQRSSQQVTSKARSSRRIPDVHRGEIPLQPAEAPNGKRPSQRHASRMLSAHGSVPCIEGGPRPCLLEDGPDRRMFDLHRAHPVIRAGPRRVRNRTVQRGVFISSSLQRSRKSCRRARPRSAARTPSTPSAGGPASTREKSVTSTPSRGRGSVTGSSSGQGFPPLYDQGHTRRSLVRTRGLPRTTTTRALLGPHRVLLPLTPETTIGGLHEESERPRQHEPDERHGQ